MAYPANQRQHQAPHTRITCPILENVEIFPFSDDIMESLSTQQLRHVVIQLQTNNVELINQLQQLNDMYRREQEANDVLQTIVTAQQERIISLENENEHISLDKTVVLASNATKPTDSNTLQRSGELALSMTSLSSYHTRLRANLRVMAECLCDELCRVDDHLSLLAPLVVTSETTPSAFQQQQQHSSPIGSTKGASPLTPKTTIDNTGFLFGSPRALVTYGLTAETYGLTVYYSLRNHFKQNEPGLYSRMTRYGVDYNSNPYSNTPL